MLAAAAPRSTVSPAARLIELSERNPGLDGRKAARRVDLDALHPGEIDDDTPVATAFPFGVSARFQGGVALRAPDSKAISARGW
jgi:hypothetical protein